MSDQLNMFNDPQKIPFFDDLIPSEKIEFIPVDHGKPIEAIPSPDKHSICTEFGCQMDEYLQEIIKLKTRIIKLEVLCQTHGLNL